MATWKTLMHPHLKCMHRHVAVFKKHVSFCLLSRVPEATFLLLALELVTAWLSHPLIAILQSLVAWAKRARGREILLRTIVESFQTLVHLESCQNHRPHVQSLVHRCPRSVLPKLAQLVVDHITLLGFALISACCVAKLGIVHQNVPTKGTATAFSPGKRAYGTHALGCAVFVAMCYGATVEETGENQDKNGIEDFVAFSIRSLEGFAILDGGASMTGSAFMSVQPVADQY